MRVRDTVGNLLVCAAVSACGTSTGQAPALAPLPSISITASPRGEEDCAKVVEAFKTAAKAYEGEHGGELYSGSTPYLIYMDYLLPLLGSVWPTVSNAELRVLIRGLAQTSLRPDALLRGPFVADLNAVEAFCPGSIRHIPPDGPDRDPSDVVIPSLE